MIDVRGATMSAGEFLDLDIPAPEPVQNSLQFDCPVVQNPRSEAINHVQLDYGVPHPNPLRGLGEPREAVQKSNYWVPMATRLAVVERYGITGRGQTVEVWCHYCWRKGWVYTVAHSSWIILDGLTYDHVIPRFQGGSDDPENIVLACRSCNSSKSSRTPAQWRGGAVVPHARSRKTGQETDQEGC